MSADTKIEWADHTFNPWIGCTKVSPGCDNCYAEAWDRRFALSGHDMHWGAGKARKLTKTWGDPVKWNRQHEAFFAQHGHRQRVFCSSLADVFDNEVDPKWLSDLLDLIRHTPNLDWLLLTKRIGNWKSRMQAVQDHLGARMDALPKPRSVTDEESDAMNWVGAWILNNSVDSIPENVWLGATIVNQEEADRDIPKLLAVPAVKRFLSMEPLLGPVDIRDYMWPVHPSWPAKYRSPSEAIADGAMVTYHRQALISKAWADSLVNWVIVGGESGPNARPLHPDWARSLRDQCVAAGVPFLFKQWGEWSPGNVFEAVGSKHVTCIDQSGQVHPYPPIFEPISGIWRMHRIGKKAAGRLLDGRTWDEVPTC